MMRFTYRVTMIALAMVLALAGETITANGIYANLLLTEED